MSRLNDETLRAVGQCAIEFSAFDELLTAMAADVLECNDWEIAQYLTSSRLTAGPKLQRIEEVCNILAKLYRLEDTHPHKAMLQEIKVAQGAITERNTVIHGELKRKHGKAPIVQLRKHVVEMSPDALSIIVDKINRSGDSLVEAYQHFMDTVHKARKEEDALKNRGRGS